MQRRSVVGVVLGGLIAVAVPVMQMVVAFLWDRHAVELEPNGTFVQSLQSATGLEFGLGPLGVVLLGYAASIRGVIGWLALLAVAVPALLFLSFVGAASLGGLAGEPF